MLKHRWKKCVDLKGDYVENYSYEVMFDYCVIVGLQTFQPLLNKPTFRQFANC